MTGTPPEASSIEAAVSEVWVAAAHLYREAPAFSSVARAGLTVAPPPKPPNPPRPAAPPPSPPPAARPPGSALPKPRAAGPAAAAVSAGPADGFAPAYEVAAVSRL